MIPEAVLRSDRVLITGPLLSGKRQLSHRLLAEWSDGPIVISTRQSASRARTEHERLTGHGGDGPVVIDCISSVHSSDVTDTVTTKYVNGPDDLTSIGTKFTELAASHSDYGVAVGVHTLSPLLMYAPVEDVYKFTKLLVQLSSGKRWPVVGVLESGIHDEHVVHILLELFDIHVETRIGEDSREFRTKSRDKISSWRGFE